MPPNNVACFSFRYGRSAGLLNLAKVTEFPSPGFLAILETKTRVPSHFESKKFVDQKAILGGLSKVWNCARAIGCQHSALELYQNRNR